MKKKQICFWVMMIAVLIIGTAIGFPLLIRRLNAGELYRADTMITLFLAAYTLEATLLIAVLIYSLQNSSAAREADRKAQNAKRIIYAELSAGLQSIICFGSSSGIGSRLFDLFLAYLPDIQNCFDSDQRLHDLIRAVDILADINANQDVDNVRTVLADFIQPQFRAVMASPFADSFSRVGDYRCVLNPAMRDILSVLSRDPLPPAGETILHSSEGRKVIECCGCSRYKVYNENGGLLCDAVFREDGTGLQCIESGWVKLWDYEGEYQNGRRHGRGCSYSTPHHHKLFDGIWRKGEPYDGVQFDIVVEKRLDSPGDYDMLFPYWNERGLSASRIVDDLFSEALDDEVDLTRLYVCNLHGLVNGEKTEPSFLRPLLGFMKKEDPKHYDAIMEYAEESKESGN